MASNNENKKSTNREKKEALNYMNESRYNFIDYNNLRDGLFSLFQDHREDINLEKKEIELSEDISDEDKQLLVEKLSGEQQIIETFSVVLNNFIQSMTDDTIQILRKALSQLNEKEYSLKRKTTLLLLFLNSNYKYVPEFKWKNIYENTDTKAKEYSLVPVDKNGKQDGKLDIEELRVIKTLLLYNQKQYKYIDHDLGLYDKLRKIRKNDYDHIFIDFLHTLKGKSIDQVLKYLEIN